MESRYVWVGKDLEDYRIMGSWRGWFGRDCKFAEPQNDGVVGLEGNLRITQLQLLSAKCMEGKCQPHEKDKKLQMLPVGPPYIMILLKKKQKPLHHPQAKEISTEHRTENSIFLYQ